MAVTCSLLQEFGQLITIGDQPNNVIALRRETDGTTGRSNGQVPIQGGPPTVQGTDTILAMGGGAFIESGGGTRQRTRPASISRCGGRHGSIRPAAYPSLGAWRRRPCRLPGHRPAPSTSSIGGAGFGTAILHSPSSSAHEQHDSGEST